MFKVNNKDTRTTPMAAATDSFWPRKSEPREVRDILEEYP